MSSIPPAPLSVCVFCGARPGNRPAYTSAARETGAMLAANGWRLVYGAGDVGLMGEVARAAQTAGGATMAYALGSAGKSGGAAVAGGARAIGEYAASAATSPLKKAGDGVKQSFREGSRDAITKTGGSITHGPNTPPSSPSATADQGQPAWAKAMKDRQTIAHTATLAVHTLKSGDSHGGGASIDTSEKD